MLTFAGTGRCGTRWLTHVLDSAGIAAGHERVHTPEAVVADPDLAVDVSWLALTHGVTPDLIVAREPAGCIGSLIDCSLFDGGRYTKAVARCINLTGDKFTDACAWWCWVNTRPAPRWRIDQPEQLPRVLARLGLDPSGIEEHTTPDVNRSWQRATRIGWDDLPCPVLEVAADWGWP